MRRSLPVLNDGRDTLDLIEIAIPCQVPWDSMPGDELVRHCGTCKQNVYNVASYTRVEAMNLLRARACLRVYRRPDNTVVTSDCRARLRAARKRGLLIFAGTLVVVLWAQICAQFVGFMGLRRLVGSSQTPTTSALSPAPIPRPGQIALPPSRRPKLFVEEQGLPEIGDWIGPDQPAPKPRKRHVKKIKRAPETTPMKEAELGEPLTGDWVVPETEPMKGLEARAK
jgi:hypothetical protein